MSAQPDLGDPAGCDRPDGGLVGGDGGGGWDGLGLAYGSSTGVDGGQEGSTAVLGLDEEPGSRGRRRRLGYAGWGCGRRGGAGRGYSGDRDVGDHEYAPIRAGEMGFACLGETGAVRVLAGSAEPGHHEQAHGVGGGGVEGVGAIGQGGRAERAGEEYERAGMAVVEVAQPGSGVSPEGRDPDSVGGGRDRFRVGDVVAVDDGAVPVELGDQVGVAVRRVNVLAPRGDPDITAARDDAGREAADVGDAAYRAGTRVDVDQVPGILPRAAPLQWPAFERDPQVMAQDDRGPAAGDRKAVARRDPDPYRLPVRGGWRRAGSGRRGPDVRGRRRRRRAGRQYEGEKNVRP